MTTTSEKIYVGIDDKVIELTGQEKEEFIRQREIEHNHYLAIVAERKAKAAAKAAAQSKLAALGLTVEDLQALGL